MLVGGCLNTHSAVLASGLVRSLVGAPEGARPWPPTPSPLLGFKGPHAHHNDNGRVPAPARCVLRELGVSPGSKLNSKSEFATPKKIAPLHRISAAGLTPLAMARPKRPKRQSKRASPQGLFEGFRAGDREARARIITSFVQDSNGCHVCSCLLSVSPGRARRSQGLGSEAAIGLAARRDY